MRTMKGQRDKTNKLEAAEVIAANSASLKRAQKETVPPDQYQLEQLNNYLRNIFNMLEDEVQEFDKYVTYDPTTCRLQFNYKDQPVRIGNLEISPDGSQTLEFDLPYAEDRQDDKYKFTLNYQQIYGEEHEEGPVSALFRK